MIDIDLSSRTYTCPFCGYKQAFANSVSMTNNGQYHDIATIPDEFKESSFQFLTIHCTNSKCKRISVVAFNRASKKQIDIVPQVVIKAYPNYIPEQIRKDYVEAAKIIDASPKAAATLLRRCLQGMIHDFWNTREKNLNAEITAIKDKVTPTQWAALDGLRKLGNIGAHMEKDVNLIIDIEPLEAKKLMQLIELLFEKWYIARHEEEALLAEITTISARKETQRQL